MPAPVRLRLDQGTREAVAERYERARSAVERTNCQMVLLADEGRSLTEIAWLARRSPLAPPNWASPGLAPPW